MADIRALEEKARLLRIDVINMVYRAKSGHIGGSLSAADMVAALYFDHMRHQPDRPDWPERDRFILSKGHAAPVLYAALARQGYFSMDELNRLRQIDSFLQGAPNLKIPGIDMSAGPLGQGLSAAVGMALAGRLKNQNYRVYCMMGDGEIQEGQIWEAAMTASKYRLNRLIGILDHNAVQMSGTNEELMPLGNIQNKFESFGWHTRVFNGNDMAEVTAALDEADKNVDAPMMLIMETTKGKGVSYMEGKSKWHGACPDEEQYRQALLELGVEMA